MLPDPQRSLPLNPSTHCLCSLMPTQNITARCLALATPLMPLLLPIQMFPAILTSTRGPLRWSL